MSKRCETCKFADKKHGKCTYPLQIPIREFEIKNGMVIGCSRWRPKEQ